MRLPSILARLVGTCVPPDLDRYAQREELARARSVVIILLISLVVSQLGFVCAVLLPELAGGNRLLQFSAALVDLVGFATALLVFRYCCAYRQVAWLFAATSMSALTLWACALPPERLAGLCVLLPLVPLCVTLIAGVREALLWLVLVALAPVLINQILMAPDSLHRFGSFFIGNWWLLCGMIYVVQSLVAGITRQMALRLTTERTEFEYAAAHDSLTALANRATFDRRIREAIDYCRRHDEQMVLAYIDLNDFKPINDSYGHHAGDAVLVAVAERLLDMVRGSDTVARLGGDEFAILFRHVRSVADIQPPVARIRDAIAVPVTLDDLCLMVSASIGVVSYPADGHDPEALKRKADALMYAQKTESKQGMSLPCG